VFVELHDVGSGDRGVGLAIGEIRKAVGVVIDRATFYAFQVSILGRVHEVEKVTDGVGVEVFLLSLQHAVTTGLPHPELDITETYLSGRSDHNSTLHDGIAVVLPILENMDPVVVIDHCRQPSEMARIGDYRLNCTNSKVFWRRERVVPLLTHCINKVLDRRGEILTHSPNAPEEKDGQRSSTDRPGNSCPTRHVTNYRNSGSASTRKNGDQPVPGCSAQRLRDNGQRDGGKVTVRVSIQVVTWNSGGVLEACLESLSLQTCPDFEVIVLDNASRDGSADVAERWFTRGLDGCLLKEAVNLGFCGGHNRALEASSGEWVLFLNPDAVLPPDFVQRCIEIVDSAATDVGSICPRILLQDGRLDSTGLVVDRFRRVYDRGQGEAAAGRYAVEEDVEGCTGAVVLHRRAMLEDVAIDGEALDENLFAYYDDIDLSWRARLYGWRCRYVPALEAIHRRSGQNALRIRAADTPRSGQQALTVRNRFLVMAKCERLIDLLKALPWLVPFEIARFLFLIVRAPGALGGYVRVVPALPTALRHRRLIQTIARQRLDGRSAGR